MMTADKAFKQAIKFISKEKYRPVLKGVCYRPDGSMAATDGMHLILIRDVHESDHEVILNKTNKVIDGKYPEIDRIIPTNYRTSFTVNVEKWLQAVESLATLAEKKAKGIAIDMQADHYSPVALSANNPELGDGKWTMDEVPGDDVDIRFNSNFMTNVLKAFKAFGYETAEIQLNGSTIPIVVSSPDAQVTCLIIPIRREVK